jgi:hypothetical protein
MMRTYNRTQDAPSLSMKTCNYELRVR